MKTFSLTFLVVFLMFYSIEAFATHNRAGEIVYRQIGDKMIEASIITYTKASSIPADRDSLVICWGDGTCEIVGRVNGPLNPSGLPSGELIAPDILKNIYRDTHNYTNLGMYTLSMEDPNRNGGILNVNFPNSDQVPFYIQTTFTLFPVNEGNTGPELLEPPIDMAFVGQPFYHTPNAFDLDGDSISYELIVPLQGEGEVVPDFINPEGIDPGPNNVITLNSSTGLLVWESPQAEGIYNIAFMIRSYRDGMEIDQTIRDMQIIVEEDDNLNPMLEVNNAILIDEINIANLGDTIAFEIEAFDMDFGQEVSISSTSGLYENFSEPAQFEFLGGPPFEATFFWIVTPEFLREQPYQVVFTAKDNFGDDGLATKIVVRFQTSPTVGVFSPQKKVVKIKAYPNPASGSYLYLDTSSISEGIHSYQLFNSQGKMLESNFLDPAQPKVKISHLSSGVYFIKGKTKTIDWTVSFIKK